jgi:hypothetical protein
MRGVFLAFAWRRAFEMQVHGAVGLAHEILK